MKKWLAAMFAAGVLFLGGFGQASAADWYYIDADADGSSIMHLYTKQMMRLQYLLKLTM